VLKHFLIAFVVIASAGAPTSAGQEERRQEPSQPQAATPDTQRDQQVQARYNIFVMEGVLERAVAHGAEQLRRQVRRLMPDLQLLGGDAQARGFRLDGYGVFFDVSVPGVRQSVAWTFRTMMHDNGVAAGAALQQLKAAIERMIPDGGERATLMQAIKRIEVQVGTPMQGEPASALAGTQRAAGRGTVTALDATPEQPEPTVTPEEKALLEDPNAAYEREVISALKDAMLDHSGPIRIGPDEWLTVAAHDNEHRNRLVPGDRYDLLTIVLRVKGSDLAAFRADRMSREEARQRVQVSEF
jgi:hypothetical protein